MMRKIPGQRDLWLGRRRNRPNYGLVIAFGLSLAMWAVIIFTAVTCSGCVGSKGFMRLTWEHYGTREETEYSAVATQVGRYFVLVEDKVNAELTTGAWYGVAEDRTYGLVGGAISWRTDGQVSLGANLKLFVPEDARGLDGVELLGGVNVEVPWR